MDLRRRGRLCGLVLRVHLRGSEHHLFGRIGRYRYVSLKKTRVWLRSTNLNRGNGFSMSIRHEIAGSSYLFLAKMSDFRYTNAAFPIIFPALFWFLPF